jgi:predicted glycosyltransferase involved in capsule biosynthesis
MVSGVFCLFHLFRQRICQEINGSKNDENIQKGYQNLKRISKRDAKWIFEALR